ncbi:MAG: FtsH protease activity modulator HflK [Thiotrichaceae bacterium]|nr:FtsH protease activity modulator HflK [Thiotrichaceae bacterium]
MPWNEPGGDKDPWGGNNKKTSSKNNNPADKVTELFSNLSNGGDHKLLLLIPIALLVLWFITGFYTIESGQRGVVLRFGAFSAVEKPGLHWLARPIDKVIVVDIDRNRTASDQTTMLTKDENIVDLKIEVQYLVKGVDDYLFNVMYADFEAMQERGVLYNVMRSAVREVVGRSDLDFVIKEGRQQIEQETHTLMQGILDKYKTGLLVKKVNLKDATAPEQVKEAFFDVTRAREEFNRSKNKAETYANKVIPDARGKAARIVEYASAYKLEVVSKAEGEASRFSQLLTEYSKAPKVTRKRLYLDMMEEVLSRSKKVILDAKSGNQVLYLPIGNAGTMPASPPMPPLNVIEKLQQPAKDTTNRTSSPSGKLREFR